MIVVFCLSVSICISYDHLVFEKLDQQPGTSNRLTSSAVTCDQAVLLLFSLRGEEEKDLLPFACPPTATHAPPPLKKKRGGSLIEGYIRRQFRFVRVTLTVRSLKTRKGEKKKSLPILFPFCHPFSKTEG